MKIETKVSFLTAGLNGGQSGPKLVRVSVPHVTGQDDTLARARQFLATTASPEALRSFDAGVVRRRGKFK